MHEHDLPAGELKSRIGRWESSSPASVLLTVILIQDKSTFAQCAYWGMSIGVGVQGSY